MKRDGEGEQAVGPPWICVALVQMQALGFVAFSVFSLSLSLSLWSVKSCWLMGTLDLAHAVGAWRSAVVNVRCHRKDDEV